MSYERLIQQRDPRKDPIDGDVLRKDGYTYTVKDIKVVYGRYTFVTYVYGRRSFEMSLTDWRAAMRKAEVLR